MSRSGYSEDCDGWELIRWRGAVASAIRGKKGQAFLREMAAALDAMPEKVLITEELEKDGEVCALGSLGRQRGLDMSRVDPKDHEIVAEFFGIPHALACEIMYENDETTWRVGADGKWGREDSGERWMRVRRWVDKNIKRSPEATTNPSEADAANKKGDQR